MATDFRARVSLRDRRHRGGFQQFGHRLGSDGRQPRSSGYSYPGTGVYKSTDAGSTWTNMGLRDSLHNAKIIIDPLNPDVVYVAAMGHQWSRNGERGVFRTRDGGTTWKRVLFVNDSTGVVDMAMDPGNPAIL